MEAQVLVRLQQVKKQAKRQRQVRVSTGINATLAAKFPLPSSVTADFHHEVCIGLARIGGI